MTVVQNSSTGESTPNSSRIHREPLRMFDVYGRELQPDHFCSIPDQGGHKELLVSWLDQGGRRTWRQPLEEVDFQVDTEDPLSLQVLHNGEPVFVVCGESFAELARAS